MDAEPDPPRRPRRGFVILLDTAIVFAATVLLGLTVVEVAIVRWGQDDFPPWVYDLAWDYGETLAFWGLTAAFVLLALSLVVGLWRWPAR